MFGSSQGTSLMRSTCMGSISYAVRVLLLGSCSESSKSKIFLSGVVTITVPVVLKPTIFSKALTPFLDNLRVIMLFSVTQIVKEQHNAMQCRGRITAIRLA